MLLVMAGCSSSPVSLVDTGAEADPTLYIFVTHECPIANRYAPEIGRIAEEHLDLVGPTVVVYADANASAKDCATHFEQYYLAYNFLKGTDIVLVKTAEKIFADLEKRVKY